MLLITGSVFSIAQNEGTPGSFSRLGFGARGMGMGNAMTAVSDGAVQTTYNPALGAWSMDRTAAASFSFLSFDRSLNFLSYTQAIKPTGGVSIGIINSGVHHIDGRDNDGMPTGELSTFENEFYLAFSNRMTPNLSLGVAVKLYWARLYEGMSNSPVGFDAGAFYKLSSQLGIGAAIQDVSTKYTWDSKPLYGIDGQTTINKFPQLRRIGVSFTPEGFGLLTSIEYENSNQGTNIVRLGGEYTFNEYFAARAGLDRWVVSGTDPGAKPTFGFSAKSAVDGFTPALTYAFVVEPFSTQGMHVLTLSTVF